MRARTGTLRLKAGRPPGTYLDVASARKVLAVLVERDGHDAVGCVESLLDAVAVVHINVNVQNALVHPARRQPHLVCTQAPTNCPDQWGARAAQSRAGDTRALEELQNRQDNVVDVAQARGLALFGVVQTTRPVDRNVREAVVQLVRARCGRPHPALLSGSESAMRHVTPSARSRRHVPIEPPAEI